MSYQDIKTLDLSEKIVGIRVDFNVPLTQGKITETTRIDAALETLKYLVEEAEVSQLHIFSHLGRPKGEENPTFSLSPIYQYIKEKWSDQVQLVKNLENTGAQIQLHENIRFYPGEEENSPELIQKMLDLGLEIFINEAFSVSHRAHASIVGPASFIPVYPGFLLQKEIESMSPYISSQKKEELLVIIGGAKINTKIGVLKHFAKTAENIIIAGALANTFLVAMEKSVGSSFYEDEQIETAQKILKIAQKNKTQIHLPKDGVVGKTMDDKNPETIELEDIKEEQKIFDIGPKTIKEYAKIISKSETIIWNGPLGCFEYPSFEAGTREILKSVASEKSAQTILGGGDTLDAIKQFNISQSAFSHVSTGGGAMLKFLEGSHLPGLDILEME